VDSRLYNYKEIYKINELVGKCLNMKGLFIMNQKQPKVFAVRHKNETVRSLSRSGGIFTALSDYILEHGGIIYGCVLTEDFKAIHIRAESKEQRDAMRGSKYIQSKMGDTYNKVKNDLNDGKIVLFSGTSCQVAGLKSFIGKEDDKLICIDVVCHGVPSPLVWEKYIKWQEKKQNSQVVGVDFRNKTDFGWRAYMETMQFENGKRVSGEVFNTLFYKHLMLRPSCHECPYKSIMHPGDITIADYWGIEKAAPEFDDDKGVSLVLVNNDKGERLFNSIQNNISWKNTRIEDSMQTPLIKPFPKPDNREEFWSDFLSKDFGVIANKYGGCGYKDRIRKVYSSIRKRAKL
jgi:coenzyme F420-reducing hydrogenase beta subunit